MGLLSCAIECTKDNIETRATCKDVHEKLTEINNQFRYSNQLFSVKIL